MRHCVSRAHTDVQTGLSPSRSPTLRAIFISYRREDSEGEAGRLCDELTTRFSEQSVFMDVDAIQPGRDFRKAIDESVHSCSVQLAILGQHWLGCTSASGQRRLDDPHDFVRLEIASALMRDIPVIPVLVHGTRMPRADQLPDDLRELAFRNGVELTHARWRSDVQVLIRAIAPYIENADASTATGLGQQPGIALSAPPPSPPFDPAKLTEVRAELAHYIGPIAEIVVKRAAKRHLSLSELCGAVALEIEQPRDRVSFLARFTTKS